MICSCIKNSAFDSLLVLAAICTHGATNEVASCIIYFGSVLNNTSGAAECQNLASERKFALRAFSRQLHGSWHEFNNRYI